MFKFTIRDLLWLTVVVALGLGWWAHWRALREVNDFLSKSRVQWVDRATYLRHFLEAHDGVVYWDDDGRLGAGWKDYPPPVPAAPAANLPSD